MSRESERELLFRGKHVEFVQTNGWEYADRPNIAGIVYIIALTENDEVVLVEQYRIPVGRKVIELPAGLAGDVAGTEGEELVTAARRELLEETGFEADEWEELTSGPPSAGITSEVVTLFRARGLRKVGDGGGDHNENIQVHVIPLSGLLDWLKSRQEEGVLVDPKLYAGLYFLSQSN